VQLTLDAPWKLSLRVTGPVGRKVKLQQRAGAGWMTLLTATTAAAGKVSFAVTAPAPGSARYRVVVPAKGAWKALTSTVRSLKVVDPFGPSTLAQYYVGTFDGSWHDPGYFGSHDVTVRWHGTARLGFTDTYTDVTPHQGAFDSVRIDDVTIDILECGGAHSSRTLDDGLVDGGELPGFGIVQFGATSPGATLTITGYPYSFSLGYKRAAGAPMRILGSPLCGDVNHPNGFPYDDTFSRLLDTPGPQNPTSGSAGGADDQDGYRTPTLRLLKGSITLPNYLEGGVQYTFAWSFVGHGAAKTRP
jgi:hypothetical protein